MKLSFSESEIKYHFYKNKKIYFWFIVFFVIGIVFGIIFSISSDFYVLLLKSSDKVLINYINGSVSFSAETLKIISKICLPLLLIFLCGLSFYSCLFSFVFVSYQSCLMFLSAIALVGEYGFSGFIKFLFFVLPTNLISFFLTAFCLVVCLKRSYLAHKQKDFCFGFNDNDYWLKIIVCFAFGIVFSILLNILYCIVLKSNIFILF